MCWLNFRSSCECCKRNVPSADTAWTFLPYGYLLTVLIEIPILLIGLSPQHAWRDRLVAGFWLTACTYPIVVLVLPPLIWAPLGRGWYLVIAEIFAPLAECLLFRAAYGGAQGRVVSVRDYLTIILANLASFGLGELIHAIY